MTRAEFSRRILSIGGTYEDVNRLEEAGYNSAWDAHRDMWEAGAMPEIENNSEFAEFCYNAGRDFVWEYMGEIFFLSRPENAEEQRKINRWRYLMRNIENISLVMANYAANEEYRDNINWGDIGSAESMLSNLRDICESANIEIKEV